MDEAEHQILGGKHFLIFRTRITKDLVVGQGAISPGNGPSCVTRNPSGFFTVSAIFLRPLELIPASRERVIPTEWQVRSVLGD